MEQASGLDAVEFPLHTDQKKKHEYAIAVEWIARPFYVILHKNLRISRRGSLSSKYKTTVTLWIFLLRILHKTFVQYDSSSPKQKFLNTKSVKHHVNISHRERNP